MRPAGAEQDQAHLPPAQQRGEAVAGQARRIAGFVLDDQVSALRLVEGAVADEVDDVVVALDQRALHLRDRRLVQDVEVDLAAAQGRVERLVDHGQLFVRLEAILFGQIQGVGDDAEHVEGTALGGGCGQVGQVRGAAGEEDLPPGDEEALAVVQELPGQSLQRRGVLGHAQAEAHRLPACLGAESVPPRAQLAEEEPPVQVAAELCRLGPERRGEVRPSAQRRARLQGLQLPVDGQEVRAVREGGRGVARLGPVLVGLTRSGETNVESEVGHRSAPFRPV